MAGVGSSTCASASRDRPLHCRHRGESPAGAGESLAILAADAGNGGAGRRPLGCRAPHLPLTVRTQGDCRAFDTSSVGSDAGLEGYVSGANVRDAVALALPAFVIVPEHIEIHHRVVMRIDVAAGNHAAPTSAQLRDGCMEPPTEDWIYQLR